MRDKCFRGPRSHGPWGRKRDCAENRRATFIWKPSANERDVAESVTCSVCGAKNPAGVLFCESCGVELAAASRAVEEHEIDKLLEELVETRAGEEGAEGLDIDKEIVDELLDSLLIEEPAEYFDCPLCGTKLPLDAKTCPKCGATFAELEEGGAAELPRPPEDEEEGVGAPALRARAAAPVARAEDETVPVAVTEDTTKLRVRSGKLIDIVVFGTIGALLAVFVAFDMYKWSVISGSPVPLLIFGAVALGGMTAGFLLFRTSTSSIAQGDQFVKDGRYEDAIYHYDRAIRMGSKPASAWTSKGVALKLDPKNEIAWCNRGDIYFRAGEMGKAVECYDKAISLRPKYAIAWNNKGAALARDGRFEEARTCQDEAVKLKPRYVAAWLNRGEVLARLGLRDEAQACLDRARALGAAT